MDKKFWANTALCLFIGGCVVFAVTNVNSALSEKGLFRHDVQPAGEVSALLDKLELRQFLTLRANNMVRADFTVTNNSDKDVENILVQCDFFEQGDGKFRDREQWLLGGVLKAGETKPYRIEQKHFIHKGAPRYECMAKNLDLVKPSMFALHHGAAGHGGGHEAGAGAGAGHGVGHEAGPEAGQGAEHGQGAHH